MFNKLLVPLDGSAAAQRALEPTFNLARKFGSEVILLQVIVVEEPALEPHGLGTAYYDLRDAVEQRLREEAEAYLKGIRTEWRRAGSPVRTEVASGAAPEMILQTAARHGVDLIVMSTHGRAGLDRLIYGSVAEAVLRGARVPVLLIPIRRDA